MSSSESQGERSEQAQAVQEFMTKADKLPAVPESARAQIEEKVLSSLEPVSPLPSTAKLILGFLLIFALLSAVFIGFVGVGGMVTLDAVHFATLLAVVGAAVFFLAVVLSREMVPGEKKILNSTPRLGVLLIPLFIAVAFLFPWTTGPNFLADSWHCFRAGLFMSVGAAGLFVLMLRRGAVLSLGVAGAAAGLLAGLVSVTVLHFGCEMHTAPHISLSHLGIAVIGAILGYVIGHFLPLLAPRRGSGPRDE